jgi:hypothetical protein
MVADTNARQLVNSMETLLQRCSVLITVNNILVFQSCKQHGNTFAEMFGIDDCE